LGNEPITIGTGEDCDVVLAGDAYVSRRHARITRDDSMILVEDLASSNGTLLRIRRSVAIEPGDELVIGTTVLRLEPRS
jgi:pSer/pThr/pTyr-binding forkhead associated (FHA) protein